MKFIKPSTITDARLVSSSLSEADHPAWAVGTSYAVGDKVIRTSTHRIYESLIASNVGNAPETSKAAWLDIGPTNRWAMFDRAVGTQSKGTGSVSVTVSPGFVDALALLNVTGATSATVTMTSGGSTVYSSSIDMGDAAPLSDWWDYFFADIEPRADATLDGLPLYGDCQVTVTVAGPGEVAIGGLVVGHLVEIGETQYGVQISIVDYSRKETDAFGVTDVIERAYAKRIEAPVLVNASRTDSITRKLAEIRATPVVWIGAGDLYQSLIAYGFYKDWRTIIQYATTAQTALTIESLT
jgi:hypothetical protein